VRRINKLAFWNLLTAYNAQRLTFYAYIMSIYNGIYCVNNEPQRYIPPNLQQAVYIRKTTPAISIWCLYPDIMPTGKI
jgi:hypothetical protein